MINSRNELKEYLEADKIALGRSGKHPAISDLIWQFEICMRWREYLHNKKGLLWGGAKLYYGIKYSILSILCNYSIPYGVFGKGLSIAHRGTIVINGAARVGENCRLHVGVNIGTMPGLSGAAPILGDNVYIAPGVKIYGKVSIASGIMLL